MNTWTTVLLGCGIAYALKLAGYVVPQHLLRGPRVLRVTTLLPVALLSGLLATQALLTSNGSPTLDSRAAAVAVAVGALLCRAPFLLVVVLAAATAAVLRHLGFA